MDPKMKKDLKKLYEAPKPVGKRDFFRKLGPKPIHTGYMVWMQVFYISKLEWVVSTVFLGAIVLMGWYYPARVLGAALAMMPFLAAASVSEGMRSVAYRMDELEMAARFSLKSIVLARMGILGLENLALALVAALWIQEQSVQSILYLLVPYLITVYGSLWIVRGISGREGSYACMGFSVAVSLAANFSTLNYGWIYQERFGLFWLIAVTVLACMVFKESRKMVRMIGCYG